MTGVSVAQYSAPPAPVVCPFPSDRRRPTLPVSLPLPRFTTQYFALYPDTAQWDLVATQLYPSSPGSRSSTPCYDLAEFDSENCRIAMSGSLVFDAVSVVPEDMLHIRAGLRNSVPRVHRCLQRLWTGGWWSRRSWICRLL